nr:DUF6572 domain-containing protein [Pedobacter glucosidilyticus]
MEWDVESNHILYLQNKLNVYLEYIESGQLFKEYPKAKDVKLRIDLVMKYEPINYSFLNHVKSELKRLGYQFDFKHLKNKQ